MSALLGIVAFLQVVTFAGPQGQGLTPPTSTTAEKDKCVVSGKVVSAQTGEPLKKANVQLTLRPSGRINGTNWQQTGYSGISGADGSFLFEAVEPGDYTLSGEKSGYIRTTYGSKSEMGSGTILNLTAGQKLTDLKFPLTTQATISGRVLDEDGDPVGGASVQAYGKMGMRGLKARYFPQGFAQTDDTGAFRLASLRPGKYFVMAQTNMGRMGMVEKPATPGKPDVRPVPTFYPSSLHRADGAAVQVAAGQDMPGVEIRMRSAETFHVRGKVVGDAADGQPGALNMLSLMPAGEDDAFPMMRNMTAVGQDHTFDIGGVTPGAYILTTANMRTKQGVVRQKIEVGQADLNGIVLTPQPDFSIRGSVDVQGVQPKNAKDKPAENITVMLQPDEQGIMFMQAQGVTKADGSLTIENVTPAKVRVYVTNVPEGAYLESIRFGGQEILGKVLDLTQAGGGDIRIAIRGGAPEVGGTVMAKQANSDTLAADPSAKVLLIPEDLTLNGGEVHMAQGNQNGAFTESGLRPGTYYVLAFDSDEYRSYDDPALLKQLAAKGVEVELKENDKKQVQLTTLQPDELAAIEAATQN